MILFEYVAATHHDPVPALIPCRTLEEIKDELQSMLERTSAVGYKETDADVHTVGELAEDVRDAVIEYQVSPTFDHPQETILNLRSVRSAERDI